MSEKFKNVTKSIFRWVKKIMSWIGFAYMILFGLTLLTAAVIFCANCYNTIVAMETGNYYRELSTTEYIICGIIVIIIAISVSVAKNKLKK